MSFHKKFCNWASQKKININKVTYKRAENAFIDTLACILSGVKEKQSKVALKYCLENNNSGKIKISYVFLILSKQIHHHLYQFLLKINSFVLVLLLLQN